MSILLLLQLAVAQTTVEELQDRIVSLNTENEFLHRQLVSSAIAYPSLIIEDLAYNKEMLQSLVSEYPTSTDKLYVAQEISYYLQALSQDLQILNTDTEDVSSEDLDSTLEMLNNSIFKLRTFQQGQDFARAYNQLQHRLDEISFNNLICLKENSKLLGEIESAKNELSSIQVLYDESKASKTLLQSNLDQLVLQHQDRIDSIENSLLLANQDSQTKDLQNFSEIQASQNSLISELQQQNTEQALKIEQQGTDLAAMENNILLQDSSIARLVRHI